MFQSIVSLSYMTLTFVITTCIFFSQTHNNYVKLIIFKKEHNNAPLMVNWCSSCAQSTFCTLPNCTGIKILPCFVINYTLACSYKVQVSQLLCSQPRSLHCIHWSTWFIYCCVHTTVHNSSMYRLQYPDWTA